MKLVTLSCPKCNAQLQVNEDLTHAICNYCGYHFLIDDESQKVDVRVKNAREVGRELEYGRRSAGSNQELANEVGAMMEPLAKISELSPQIDRITKVVEVYKKKTKNDKSTFGKLLPWIWCAGLFVLFLAGGSDSGSILETILTALFIGLTAAGITYLVQYSHKSSLKGSMSTLSRLTKEMEANQQALQGHDIEIIPPDYRNRVAMSFIYNALRNQRAMTMQEAVNLYEDNLHKNRLEAMEAEQLKQLSQINRSVRK